MVRRSNRTIQTKNKIRALDGLDLCNNDSMLEICRAFSTNQFSRDRFPSQGSRAIVLMIKVTPDFYQSYPIRKSSPHYVS